MGLSEFDLYWIMFLSVASVWAAYEYLSNRAYQRNKKKRKESERIDN